MSRSRGLAVRLRRPRSEGPQMLPSWRSPWPSGVARRRTRAPRSASPDRAARLPPRHRASPPRVLSVASSSACNVGLVYDRQATRSSRRMSLLEAFAPAWSARGAPVQWTILLGPTTRSIGSTTFCPGVMLSRAEPSQVPDAHGPSR